MLKTVGSILLASLCLLTTAGCGNGFGLASGSGTSEGVAEVSLALPSFDSMAASAGASSVAGKAMSKVSSAKVYANAASSSNNSGYGLPSPATLTDVTCFAVAVEWPEARSKGNTCGSSSSSVSILPGLFQGLFLPGQDIELKIPSGNGRKIYLLGFAAADPSLCVDFFANNGPPRELLSPPHIIGELNVDLTPGKRRVSITPSIENATSMGDCGGPLFEAQVDPVTVEKPAITLVLPPTGLVSGGDQLMIYGTGFKSSASVMVGTLPCLNQNVISPTQISCTTPAGAAGPSSIAVVSAEGNVATAPFFYRSAAMMVADASASEGGTLQFRVSLTQPLPYPVSFTYSTSDGTALANLHYKGVSGSGTIQAGSVSALVSVPTIDNSRDEEDQSFSFKVLSVTNASLVSGLAQGLIQDDDVVVAPTDGGQFEVHVVGVYEARTDHGYMFHPEGTAVVNIAAGQKKMILVLSSYEPVKWDLRGAVGEVEKVILNGYHDQSVIGIDASKVVEGSYLGTGKPYYPKYVYDFSTSSVTAPAFLDFVKGDTGMAITSSQGKYTGTSFGINGPALVLSTPTATPAATPASSPTATPAPYVASIRASYSSILKEGEQQNIYHIYLDRPATAPVSVSWRAVNETAYIGSDFSGSGYGTVTIMPGMSFVQLSFPIVDDQVYEQSETFRVELYAPMNAVLGPVSFARMTINDNELAPTNPTPTPSPTPTAALPKVSITNNGVEAASEGAHASFSINLDKASTSTVTVTYSTIGETATIGPDFMGVTGGKITFNPGVIKMNVSVPVSDDSVVEQEETFRVDISNPVNADAGAVMSAKKRILDIDVHPIVGGPYYASMSPARFAAEGLQFKYRNLVSSQVSAWQSVKCEIREKLTGLVVAGPDQHKHLFQAVLAGLEEKVLHSLFTGLQLKADIEYVAECQYTDETFTHASAPYTGRSAGRSGLVFKLSNAAPTPTPTPVPVASPSPTPAPVTASRQPTPVTTAAIQCTGRFTSGGSVGLIDPVYSVNACISYCDVVANNNSGYAMNCDAGGQIVASYSLPRTQTVPAQEGVACVARIGSSTGVFDHIPQSLTNATSCRSFCDSQPMPAGGTKQCVHAFRVIHDYNNPTATPTPAPTPPPPPTLSFESMELPPAHEGQMSYFVRVKLSAPSTQPVNFMLRGMSESAFYGEDFMVMGSTFQIPPGMLYYEARIDIHDDTMMEPEEFFRLEIAQPMGAMLGQHYFSRVRIWDNDGGPMPPGGTTQGVMISRVQLPPGPPGPTGEPMVDPNIFPSHGLQPVLVNQTSAPVSFMASTQCEIREAMSGYPFLAMQNSGGMFSLNLSPGQMMHYTSHNNGGAMPMRNMRYNYTCVLRNDMGAPPYMGPIVSSFSGSFMTMP